MSLSPKWWTWISSEASQEAQRKKKGAHIWWCGLLLFGKSNHHGNCRMLETRPNWLITGKTNRRWPHHLLLSQWPGLFLRELYTYIYFLLLSFTYDVSWCLDIGSSTFSVSFLSSFPSPKSQASTYMLLLQVQHTSLFFVPDNTYYHSSFCFPLMNPFPFPMDPFLFFRSHLLTYA